MMSAILYIYILLTNSFENSFYFYHYQTHIILIFQVINEKIYSCVLLQINAESVRVFIILKLKLFEIILTSIPLTIGLY